MIHFYQKALIPSLGTVQCECEQVTWLIWSLCPINFYYKPRDNVINGEYIDVRNILNTFYLLLRKNSEKIVNTFKLHHFALSSHKLRLR